MSAGLGGIGTADYSVFAKRPTMKTETRPTTVVPPITPATAGAPIYNASIDAPRAANPITKPKICPLATSLLAARNAASSISRWCLASSSAITKMRSAAPGIRRLYPSSTAGGGIGPENVDCWNCATCFPLGTTGGAIAPFVVLTEFLGGFCFCCCGRAMFIKSSASARNSLASMSEMTSHTFARAAARSHFSQIARGSQIHHATDASKEVFCSGIHSEADVNLKPADNQAAVISGKQQRPQVLTPNA